MFTPGFILSTLAHLEAAQHNQSHVSVWQAGELLESGPIQRITDIAVTINGADYLLTVCEFRLR